MSVSFARSCGAAIVLSLSAQAALADVSAQDVWSDWKSYMTTTGYKVTGTEAKSGNTLTVSDLLLEMPVMDAEASGSIAMPNIQFVENGDGTVNILLPKEMPLQFKMDGPDGAVEGTFIYSHDGSPMLVSGDTDEMTYDYATALMGFSLSGLSVPGEDIPAEAVKFKATLTDVVTKTVMTKTDLRSYEQTLTSASLDYDFGVTDPEGKGEGSFKGALQGLTFNGTTSIPDGTESADMAALLRNGLSASGRFDFAGGNSAISGRERRDSFAMESASQGGSISFDMSDAGLTYDVRQNQTELNISGSDIPFPLALSMAETGFKLMVPVTKSDEEQDFGLAVFLRDFDVPEVLWGMVDPTGALPHDPATIAIDLAGKAKLAFDMFDPASMEAIDNGELAPGELNALSVNALEVSVAGAELTGTGDFTFNNNDLETYDGMPAPSGEANLKLVGANTLLDTLISMGLVSDSDAMGARMMMGLLAVPGDGEDTLTSKIELTEDGQIKANGQRIK